MGMSNSDCQQPYVEAIFYRSSDCNALMQSLVMTIHDLS